jgi:Rrf2 family protein
MLLNRTVIYTLRALTSLSLQQEKEQSRLSARELSDETNIPQHYLSKIMRSLVSEGIVDGMKGHGGGFALAVQPRELFLSAIFTAVQFELKIDTCVFDWNHCSNENPCPLHNYWKGFREEWQSWAALTSLQDLLDGNLDSRYHRLTRRYLSNEQQLPQEILELGG